VKAVGPPAKKIWRPLSGDEIGVLAGGETLRQRVARDIGGALESSGKSKFLVWGRRLSIGAEAPVRIGLGAVLRQRVAYEVGQRIAGV
jgi:hypothetical protein